MKKTLIFGIAILILATLIACSESSTTTQPSTGIVPAVTTQSAAAGTQTTAVTTAAAVKPTGELVTAVTTLGNESFVPWAAVPADIHIMLLVYEVPIYYEESTGKHIPGLVESWEQSADYKTVTFHVRKGIPWHEGWGEVTAEDIKYTFTQLIDPKASCPKIIPARQITNMEVPDPYTLVITLRQAIPGWWQNWSMGQLSEGQGIVCKKYFETVGYDTASNNPIGSGPYKLVEKQLGDHYKFEAYDEHWRVVPEFKNITLRIVPEITTIAAMLKTGEIDLAQVTAEQVVDLKADGKAVESNSYGGVCNHLIFGGLLDPEIDKRFIKDYHRKDPWADIRVRKAMNLAIDRKAFCKAIFNDTVSPLGVPIGVPGSEKYQYPYDPAAAKQLLAEAGYPDGFEFELYSWSREGQRSLPLVVEAVQGYWKEIGLRPKLINTEHVTFQRQSILTFKTAGKVYLQRHTVDGDPLLGDAVHYTPEGAYGLWEDAASYNMFKEARAYVEADKRKAGVDKLLQYWHENYAVVPLFRFPYIYAWDSKKIAPFPHPSNDAPYYLEYVRHAEPLNTFRLFTPWQGR